MGGQGKNKEQPVGGRNKKCPFGWLKNGNPPCDLHSLPRCGAKAKSTGMRCCNPAMKGKRVCRFHGGKSPGAPKGNNRALKHGYYISEAVAERRYVRKLIKRLKDVIYHAGMHHVA